ncbi:BON domain-containing protein [Caballeronia sp. BR00000012568055]|uniref:BON domain-containing protein n=1 Tax=Caballeronia sp. BR00000012568055 TaxID=2918761 RepID=UPI0027D29E29|nr:BON domain-containing protein [Caballeronia sp. BR00000012568055]
MPKAVSRLWVLAVLATPIFMATSGCKSAPETPAAASAPANDDASLAVRVKSALAADPALRPLPMSVATYRGVVQLSGYVDSTDQIQRAIAVARSVAGVQSVNNDLYVRPR